MKGCILVTGGHGFVGQALVPGLLKAFPQAEVCTSSRSHRQSLTGTRNIVCDLTDRAAVTRLVGELKPVCIVNLAAISHIPTAINSPELTWQTNLQGTLHLLDALVADAIECTFLQVGSSDCYGRAFAGGDSLSEQTRFEPLNPYAASKAAADLAAYSYSVHSTLKVIRARPFNHTGAGQSNRFVVSAFAEQVARIEAGLQPPVMQVGNLQAQRCFLHLDDVVDAYIALIHRRDDIESGEAFNIVSAEAVSISHVLEQLVALSSCDIAIEVDPEKVRPVDIPLAHGSSQKIADLANWQAQRDLPYILTDVLQYWRKLTLAQNEQ